MVRIPIPVRVPVRVPVSIPTSKTLEIADFLFGDTATVWIPIPVRVPVRVPVSIPTSKTLEIADRAAAVSRAGSTSQRMGEKRGAAAPP
jgi:hypothetical protein